MMLIKKITLMVAAALLLASIFIMPKWGGSHPVDKEKVAVSIYEDAKPYTRWWWFARILNEEDIRDQLIWVKEKGFGGVEIAWIYPVNRDPDAPRTKWLSEEWSEKVAFTKLLCDSLGLGCDYTYGTLWPFGGTFLPDKYATKVYNDSSFWQPLRLSWTHPDTGNVLDHMSKEAFTYYSSIMSQKLKPALKGKPVALFCDSWEVETRRIWSEGFGEEFNRRYGYRIEPYMDSIYQHGLAGERYDYMRLVSEWVLNNFYIPFTEECHNMGALSRVQCAGSPTDLIEAYSHADIPETEAMLYEPNFGKIVSSAATLSGKPIVSSESFTCMYGFPDNYHKKENTGDVKLLADALVGNGVNQIIWHGMPYNPVGVDTIEFYATVHVGKTGTLTEDLNDLNSYMQKLSSLMRKGKPYTDLAVYLPVEDSWIAGEYPKEQQMKWSWGQYEMRYIHFPDELTGFQPCWINKTYLQDAKVENAQLLVNGNRFSALVVNSDYIDKKALEEIHRLAIEGLQVFFLKEPKQAGKIKNESYAKLMNEIKMQKGYHTSLNPVKEEALIQGDDIDLFRARSTNEGLLLFFPHPLAWNLSFPLEYEFSVTEKILKKDVVINYGGNQIPLQLEFKPNKSLLYFISKEGKAELLILH